MGSSDDRRAALVLAVLAVLGVVVRLLLGGGATPGAVAYRFGAGAGPSRDSTAAVAARLARPLVAGEWVDVDRASASELTRLPRVGAGLAARIVAEREANGAFGSLDALSRVPGMGPATRAAIRPYARFSGTSRAAASRTSETTRVAVNRADAAELATLPGVGPHLAQAIVEDRARNGPYRAPGDLLRVRGIGPGVLKRIEGRIFIP